MRASRRSASETSCSLPDFPRKRRRMRSPVTRHVARAQRRQPEAAVVAAIALVADAHERAVEQANHRGQQLARAAVPVARGRARPRAGSRAAARRSPRADGTCAVALRAPLRVIAVLQAAACVAAGRLQMTLRIGADPDGRPCGRDRERPDPREDFGAAYRPPAVVDVAKRVGRALAAPTGIAGRL